MTSAIPVMIAGAGPAGLVLALTLSINGIAVRVVDLETKHRVGSKGYGISPRSLELLHFVNVLDDIRAELVPIREMRDYKIPGGTEVVRSFPTSAAGPPPSPDSPYTLLTFFDQDALEDVLRRHLSTRFGVSVELGTKVESFDQSAGHVDVRLQKTLEGEPKEETVRAQYLVGTDGGRSTIRRALNLGFMPGARSETKGIVYGDAVITGLEEQISHRFGDPSDKMFTLRAPTRVGSNRWSFFLIGAKLQNEDSLAKSPEAFERFFQQATGRTDVVFSNWDYLTVHRATTRMTDTFSKGRVFIAGDAGHTHSPAGGQGLNSSMQDSFSLGWKLALVLKKHASPRLLETYSEERVPVIAEMLQRSNAVLDAMQSGDQARVQALWREPAIRQLTIHCEWSAIVFDERRAGGRAAAPESPYIGTAGLWAGDRAPNAPDLRVLYGAKGPQTELFDLFHPAKHTVLVFVRKDAPVSGFLEIVRRQPAGTCAVVLVFEQAPEGVSPLGADVAVVDTKRYAAQFYEVEQGICAVVVRPDGIVAAMVRTTDGLAHAFELVFDNTQ